MHLDLKDYISGGYTLVKVVERLDWMDAKRVPEHIISLSFCTGIHFNVMWGWDIGQYQQEIISFGIPQNRLAEFVTWNNQIGEQGDLGFPWIFASTTILRELVNRFIPDTTALRLVGLGVHRERAESAWPKSIHDDTFNQIIAQKRPPEPDGVPLGFEVVGVDRGLECSWYCSGIDDEMHQLYGINRAIWACCKAMMMPGGQSNGLKKVS
jgi:hypothetical protein